MLGAKKAKRNKVREYGIGCRASCKVKFTVEQAMEDKRGTRV
jgi:hypothetical protein